MKKRITCLCILVITLLTGCTAVRSAKDVRRHMITQVNITCQGCEEIVRRHYESSDKIRFFLLALRKLGPDFPAGTDVDALSGKTIRIQMTCADGSVITYLVKNNQYLQKNGGPWRQISTEQFTGFWQMILQIPSDESRDLRWDPLPLSSAHHVYFPIFRAMTGR